LVDAHHVPGDDLSLLDRAEGRVVVGDDLSVNFEQQPVGPVHDAALGVLVYHCLHPAKRSAAVSLRQICLCEPRSAARTARRWTAIAMCSCAEPASRGSRWPANSRTAERECSSSPATTSASVSPPPALCRRC